MYDVIIIGAGATGIVSSLELARQGKKVLLVESGFERPAQDAAQALNTGFTNGDLNTDPGKTRSRGFGGTMHQWEIHLEAGIVGGRFVELEPLDFEGSSQSPLSAWPICYEDLKPFYEKAKEYLGVEHLCKSPADHHPLESNLMGTGIVAGEYGTADFRFQLKKWKKEIEESANIELLLGHTLSEILLNTEGDEVTGVKLRPTEDSVSKPVGFSGTHYILAAGVIENARILQLNTHAKWPKGLGNNSGWLGKAYMDHTVTPLCMLKLPPSLKISEMAFFDRQKLESGERIGYLTLCEELRRKHDLLSLGMILIPMPKWINSKGVEAFKNVLKGKIEQLPIVLRNLNEIVLLLKSKLIKTKMFSLNEIGWSQSEDGFNDQKFTQWMLAGVVEQKPRIDNAIHLSEVCDELGQRKAKLSWEYNESDVMHLTHTKKAVCDIFSELGLLSSSLGTEVYSGSHHHFGGARMHDDPEQGVTDKNGHIHGIRNLSLAGNSVACSSGMVNPTLTSLALSLRMVNCIKY